MVFFSKWFLNRFQVNDRFCFLALSIKISNKNLFRFTSFLCRFFGILLGIFLASLV